MSLVILPHSGQYTHFLSPGFLLCKMRVLAEISPIILSCKLGLLLHKAQKYSQGILGHFLYLEQILDRS